ncbi:hypothetical protein INT46_009375 [Mucor plumbeus]|uniref:Uncharacterized protein n=1 Tax=Mucor plumbeus TaxID=97098 RepID=A0A8H7QRE4_9FUNG|nr:hypothetical protein INT46_009375 [Mucor plumbeus]
MNLQRKIHIADCIAADGGYTLFVNKFKEISSDEGYDFSDKNFSTLIRKESGIKLTSNEITYNTKFGVFRSGNESIYSTLATKFDRFNNNESSLQISKIDTYNLQFKVGHNDDFNLPTKVNRINYVFLNEAKNNENCNEMIGLQEKYLKLELDDNDMEMEYESDEEIEELKHKKIKNNKQKTNKKAVVIFENLNIDKR